MKTLHIDKPVNLVYTEVKRKLEDRKTSVFIIMTAVNIFLWGLLLAEYRNTLTKVDELIEKNEVTQIYLNKLKEKINE